VTSMSTKHAHKRFLSQLRGFFIHISFGFEGWLRTEWVVSFDEFDCFLLFLDPRKP
jgi:hypothetical protein